MAPAAAILIGAGIAAAGNVAGNYMRSQSEKENAGRLSDASQQQLEAYKKAYEQAYGAGSYNDQTQAMGLDAAKVYQSMLNNPNLWNEYLSGDNAYRAPEEFSFTAEDLYNDPSYQLRLKQGQDALAQTQVAGGLNLSGAAAKQMNDYTQNVASTEFANAYNRANSQYNKDRTFNFNAWLTNANRYYNNLASQLAGQNNLSNAGITANTNQAVALQGLAGNQGNAAAQMAAAQNSANSSNANFLSGLVSNIGNLGGLAFSQMGTSGDTPTAYDTGSYDYGTSNPYTQDNAVLMMNGYNPYLQNNLG